jgi:hypothetical protein
MATAENAENDNIATGAIVDGTQALNHDAYDVQEFNHAVETYRRLADIVSAAGQDLRTAPALIRDLFWSFHKWAPRISEDISLRPAFAINRQILEEVMTSAEWRLLRESTVNDSMIATIATIGACERAIKALDPNSRVQINQLAAASEAVEKLFDQAAALDEMASRASAGQVAELHNRAAQARAEAERQERAAT